MGTPAYMAPEQAHGEVDRVNERCDVFALGSILCAILTGRPAFEGRNSGEIERKAARGDLVNAMSRLDAIAVDAELVALAKACLAPERDDRPRDAKVVADAIKAYRDGVEERLRRAERERIQAETRAEEESKRRVLADQLVLEERKRRILSDRLVSGRTQAPPRDVSDGGDGVDQPFGARRRIVPCDPAARCAE